MSSTDPAFKKKKQNKKRHFVYTCLVEYVDMGPVDIQGWLWASSPPSFDYTYLCLPPPPICDCIKHKSAQVEL